MQVTFLTTPHSNGSLSVPGSASGLTGVPTKAVHPQEAGPQTLGCTDGELGLRRGQCLYKGTK